jgi:hypothetical protein
MPFRGGEFLFILRRMRCVVEVTSWGASFISLVDVHLRAAAIGSCLRRCSGFCLRSM